MQRKNWISDDRRACKAKRKASSKAQEVPVFQVRKRVRTYLSNLLGTGLREMCRTATLPYLPPYNMASSYRLDAQREPLPRPVGSFRANNQRGQNRSPGHETE